MRPLRPAKKSVGRERRERGRGASVREGRRRSERPASTDGGLGACGCLVIYVISAFIITCFFPSLQNSPLLRPVVTTWEALTHAPLPACNMQSAFYGLLVAVGVALVGFLFGLILAISASRIQGVERSIALWGSVSSIVSFLLTLLGFLVKGCGGT